MLRLRTASLLPMGKRVWISKSGCRIHSYFFLLGRATSDPLATAHISAELIPYVHGFAGSDADAALRYISVNP
jgi:hypothetical protein